MVGSFACRQDMQDQPRYEPLEASDFFTDGRASRPFVQGTIARGQLATDAALQTGKVDNVAVTSIPLRMSAELLRRGRERFDIYCAPCHDRAGTGVGMVVQRGYRQPPSLHVDRLRESPPGYLFDVITNGFGAMPDYANQTTIEDRWAIVAYMQALQLSQHASVDDMPAAERERLGANGRR
jgi:mono/diheme cytochrome c family protein